MWGMKLNPSRLRTKAAQAAARLATRASRLTGRGAGGMIGGLVAGLIDPNIMNHLGGGRPVALVTGTNGKSTTTRMLASALRSHHTVATNDGGDNMDAGIISALMAGKDATHVVLECDELHVPAVAVPRYAPQFLRYFGSMPRYISGVEMNSCDYTLLPRRSSTHFERCVIFKLILFHFFTNSHSSHIMTMAGVNSRGTTCSGNTA